MIFAVSTKGKRNYCDVTYSGNDTFLFSHETRWLPVNILNKLSEDQVLRIPIVADSRSLNLSNAVTAMVYEAWRQQQFTNGC